jgi:hypothetical protein
MSVRMDPDPGARRGFVACEDGLDEAHARRTAVHQQIVDIPMAELQSHVVRRQAEPEGPTVDVERGHRCITRLVDPSGDRRRVGVQDSRRQRHIAEATRHENVGVGSALEKTTADLRPCRECVLCRRRLVIRTPYVHVGAVFDQHIGNRHRCRLMERLLPIATSRVYELRIRDEQLS